jgi:hypothetical protein
MSRLGPKLRRPPDCVSDAGRRNPRHSFDRPTSRAPGPLGVFLTTLFRSEGRGSVEPSGAPWRLTGAQADWMSADVAIRASGRPGRCRQKQALMEQGHVGAVTAPMAHYRSMRTPPRHPDRP